MNARTDTEIKRPALTAAAPPFFEVWPGHSVKVLESDNALWVSIICVEGDDLLGVVVSRDLSPDRHELRWRDVIEFKRCHVFGLY